MPPVWPWDGHSSDSRTGWTMRDARQAEDLAVLVADGATPNWQEALDSAADERERRVIGHLRVLDSVARYHRAAGDLSDADAEGAAGGKSPLGSESMSEIGGATIPRASVVPAESRWGHLELRERLGSGAFGDVYRAWDPSLDREVALKLLKREVSNDPALAPRIVEEGRMLAKL